MKKALAGILAIPFAVACLPAGSNAPQYEIPAGHGPCDGVNLSDGEINGAAEFEKLFACLNDLGSLDALAPMIDDLGSTTNPLTGEVYLEDLVGVTNAVLADPDLAHVVTAVSHVVSDGQTDAVLPAGAAIIDSGLVHQLLPVMQSAIDSGSVAHALPATSQLLKDPSMPHVLAASKSLLDDGLQQGWLSQMLPDLATILTVKDPQGNPALRHVLPPMDAWLASGQTGGLVPMLDQLHDSGTLTQLLGVTRKLSDQGVLAQMGPDLRPLMLHDANGFSDLQGTLEILKGSDGPLKCFGVTVVPNLAENILSTMADRTPADIQNLVSILEATIGLGTLVCDIPQPVQDDLSSLDALAKSGALDGMLPILKVFKAQSQIPLLVRVLVQVRDSNALPALEPMLVAAIDAGVLDRAMAVVPHLIQADGSPAPEMSSLLDALDLLVSPTNPSDPSTAPAAALLPLLGAAGTGAEQQMADALYVLGTTIQDPGSHFDAVLPALDAAMGADPDGTLIQLLASLIDDGSIARSLPMASHVIASGNADAMLPWTSQMIHDGTAAALLQMMADAFALMNTGG
jgi:hypothetical protein